MDKNSESKFTSDFWREINESFFQVQQPIDIQHYNSLKKRSSNYVNINCQQLLNKLIKHNHRSKLQQLNYNNLKQRLSLYFLQREINNEPIQNIIDEMIDHICYQNLQQGLLQTQELLTLITQQTEQQQIEIYNQESYQLNLLHQQIDWPDELSQKIQEHQEILSQLIISNQSDIQQLKQHEFQINNTLVYKYTIKNVGEYQLKLTRERIQYHSEELSLLQQLIISQEDQQVAESIGKATFNERSNTITVVFDKYLSQTPIDLNLEHFANLQRLREQPYELTDQLPGLRSDDVFEMQMCHYCRQMVEIKNLKQCSYNHYSMGLHEYNEDLMICQRYQINAKQQVLYFQDLYSTNYVIENQQIQCKRFFCLKCLKYEFDSYDTNLFQWICPLCKGLCSCIRCSRNDTIYKLKRQFLELNGNLEDIYNQSYFELLVSEKRKQIQNIPIEFVNLAKLKPENEETLTPKSNTIHKRSVNKNVIKKKIRKSENNGGGGTKVHKLSHIESSSSSVKIKKPKEEKKMISNFNESAHQLFVQ